MYKGGTILEAKAYDFLCQHKTMVLACMEEDGTPYCLPLTYYLDETFTFYFTTPKPSRKYNNMMKNPTVQFVVFDDRFDPTSVTVEGNVSEVTDQQRCRDITVSIVDRVWKDTPFFPTSFRLEKKSLAVMSIKAINIEWFQDKVLDSVIEKKAFTRI